MYVGTLTHMAPELLIPDALADAAVDVSSFWEGRAGEGKSVEGAYFLSFLA